MENINISLYQDWINILRNRLSDFGYSISDHSDENISRIYLNLEKRLIPQKARRILKHDNFYCPDEMTSGLKGVEEAITSGQNLLPYLSKRIKKPNYNDALLNHWGIHHLHLGKTIGRDGFVEHGNPLLFCRFDDENAYFINVLTHGAWAEQDMIRVLHKNWPDSIKQFQINGLIRLTQPITDSDIKTFRQKKINTFVEVEDGAIYGAIGGGFASSGISIDVVRQADQYEAWLNQNQAHIINNIENIRNEARKKNIELPSTPHFELKIENNTEYAVESVSKICIKLH
ncbi:hypothetical protein [Cobetia sp. UCD-24C]|uniref:hypothetical protein n=1 Tax=Cobetia sp. UCD-24C TaxID=1716176 RepID=UPI00128F2DAB|nr:hypothetical protein [Cobetia sp. UCD-24C]